MNFRRELLYKLVKTRIMELRWNIHLGGEEGGNRKFGNEIASVCIIGQLQIWLEGAGEKVHFFTADNLFSLHVNIDHLTCKKIIIS